MNTSKLLSLQQTLQQLLNTTFVTKSLSIAFAYIAIMLFASQWRVLTNIFAQSTPLIFKLQVSAQYLVSVFSITGILNSLLFFCIALLIGLNTMLAVRKMQQIQSQKNLRWTFGVGLLSLSTAGCPACGFSILSVTGISGASFLPLHTFGLSVLAIIILLATGIYNLHSLQKIYCPLPLPTSGKKDR